jgi:hypothetical protein
MAHGGIVASNALLADRIASLRTLLNSGKMLRLFQNMFTPAPDDILSDFTQATFTGYAAQSLSSAFAAGVKIIDGEYQSTAGPFTFTCSGGSAQTVYGWYIDDGSNVFLSNAFSAPITMVSGASFSITINAQDWSLCIVTG